MQNAVKYIVILFLFFPLLANAKTCESNYKNVSPELIKFIDKKIGLDVFLYVEKVKRKHNLTYRICRGKKYGFTDNQYCKKDIKTVYAHGGGINVYNGLHSVYHRGDGIGIGMILNGRYYLKDVKDAISQLLPNVFSKKELQSDRNGLGGYSNLYKYKNSHFSIDAAVYGHMEDNEKNKLSNTIIDFRISDDNFDYQRCKEKEKIKLKGGSLILE